MNRLGRYRVDGEIGRGAMGVVYRATDPEIDRVVAIKVLRLPQEVSPDRVDELRMRFVREARAAGALLHPAIVALHDVGRAEDGTPYIVMEYCEGGSLAARLDGAAPPEPAEALRLGAQIARGLAEAHRRGIVHRDVKPANLLFSNGSSLKIADFGVAKFADSELTESGGIVGSPAYMAPEQIVGDQALPASDVYSLCAVLYRWLTGRTPHVGEDLRSLLYRVVHVDAPAAATLRPDLDPSISETLARGLDRDPARRWPGADALASALESRLEEPEAEARSGGWRAATFLGRPLPARVREAWEAIAGAAADSAVDAGAQDDLDWSSLPEIDGGEERPARTALPWTPRPRFVVAAAVALLATVWASWDGSGGPSSTVPLLNAVARRAAALAGAADPALVEIELRHRLEDATFTVVVDGKLTAVRHLAAAEAERDGSIAGLFRPARREEAVETFPVALSPGEHAIELRVVENGRESSSRVRGLFAEGETRRLSAEMRRFPRRLEVEWGN